MEEMQVEFFFSLIFEGNGVPFNWGDKYDSASAFTGDNEYDLDIEWSCYRDGETRPFSTLGIY